MSDSIRSKDEESLMGREEREMWRGHRVEAASVADFLVRYFKPTRYRPGDLGSESAAAAALLRKFQEEYERFGIAWISHHDSVTGRVVAFYGPGLV